MILKQLRDAFDSEADVLNEALSLEREKTPVILQARGRRLKELSDRSDALLADLTRLEEERHALFQSFIEKNRKAFESTTPGIESFIAALQSLKESPDTSISNAEWASLLDDLILSISNFRNTAIHLKKEVHANQQLLSRTRRVIQNLMDDLERPSPAYSPQAKPKPRTGGASPLILNTNA
jgi:transposase